MMSKLDTKSKKIKALQFEISEMYRRLESSYKIDRIVELENRLAEFQNINSNLTQTITDLDKVKNEQQASLNQMLSSTYRDLSKISKSMKRGTKKW